MVVWTAFMPEQLFYVGFEGVYSLSSCANFLMQDFQDALRPCKYPCYAASGKCGSIASVTEGVTASSHGY
jgi:hypothetical protein